MKWFLVFILTALKVQAQFNAGINDAFNGSKQIQLENTYLEFNDKSNAFIAKGKFSYLMPLPGTWQFYSELAIPYAILNSCNTFFFEIDSGVIHEKKPTCTSGCIKKIKQVNHYSGLSDISGEIFFITPEINKWDLGFGADFYFPTASEKPLGSGKYCLRPNLGVQFHPQGGMRGNWAVLMFKYLFSYATRYSAPNLKIFTVNPGYQFNLPHKWTLAFSPELQMNCYTKRWFVPFNVQIGKVMGRRFGCSFQYNQGIVKDFPLYNYQLQLTLRYLL